jgi:hypothetical protein
MKWRAFSRMPQWVRLSEWLGVSAPYAARGCRAQFAVHLYSRRTCDRVTAAAAVVAAAVVAVVAAAVVAAAVVAAVAEELDGHL